MPHQILNYALKRLLIPQRRILPLQPKLQHLPRLLRQLLQLPNILNQLLIRVPIQRRTRSPTQLSRSLQIQLRWWRRPLPPFRFPGRLLIEGYIGRIFLLQPRAGAIPSTEI